MYMPSFWLQRRLSSMGVLSVFWITRSRVWSNDRLGTRAVHHLGLIVCAAVLGDGKLGLGCALEDGGGSVDHCKSIVTLPRKIRVHTR